MKDSKKKIAAICVVFIAGLSVILLIIIQQREAGNVIEREQEQGIMLQVCTDTPRGMINVAFLETQGISQADATRLLAQLTDCPERARVQALILPSNNERGLFVDKLRDSYQQLLTDGLISGQDIAGIDLHEYTPLERLPTDVMQQVIANATELGGAR